MDVMWILWDALLVGVPALVALWLVRVWGREHASDRIPVLCYHRLTSKADLDSGRLVDDEPVWTVLDTEFAAQLDHLQEAGYETLDLDAVMAIKRGERPAPAKGVVITFDDGYESVLRLGAPLLQARGQTAVVYALLQPDSYTTGQVEGVDRICTHDEIVALQEAGLQIGSHSMTHAILSDLPADKLKWEVETSRRELAELTGRTVDHFCIPRGGVSKAVVDAVRAAGYQTCSGRAKGTARLSDDWLELPRIAVERHHTAAAFRGLLTPRKAFVHKVLGDLRLIPTRLFGARWGRKLRSVLYGPALGWLFSPRHVKRLLLLAGAGYVLAVAHLVSRRFL